MAIVHLSRPVKQFSGSRQSLADIALEGFEALLASGGPPPEVLLLTSAHPWELAGIAGPDLAEQVAARARELGLSTRVEFYANPGLEESTAHLAASAAGAALFHEGARRVARGEAARLAVLGVEQMRLTEREKTTQALRSLIHPEERSTGLTMPALGALLTRRFEIDFPGLSQALTALTIANRSRTANNPRAHMRKTIRLEEISGERNPIVSDPLRLFDVAPTSSGYAGLFLSAEPAPHSRQVVVAGIGRGLDLLSVARRLKDASPWNGNSGGNGNGSGAPVVAGSNGSGAFPVIAAVNGSGPNRLPGVHPLPASGATREAMNELLGHLDWTPEEFRGHVAYAEIHDAFPIIEFLSLLDSGLVTREEIVDEILAGAFDPGGRIPVNVMGGVMGGHPVGATGVGQIVELYLQAMGRAETKVAGPGRHYAFALNVGGPLTYNCVTLLSAYPTDYGPPRAFELSQREHAIAADLDRMMGPELRPGDARVLSGTRLEFPPPGYRTPCHIALAASAEATRFVACLTEPPRPGELMTLVQTNGHLSGSVNGRR